MKKVPTLFERDWNGDRSRVTREIHKGCEWVILGEGVATRKIDGICAMIRYGKLYKRHEVKKDRKIPEDFEPVEEDKETGNIVGWIPIGNGPEDKYFREALTNALSSFSDGTYELVGPKIQKNLELFDKHYLINYNELSVENFQVPRDFDDLVIFLSTVDWEGVVWHHPDGRMAKIKKRDFGLKRGIEKE